MLQRELKAFSVFCPLHIIGSRRDQGPCISYSCLLFQLQMTKTFKPLQLYLYHTQWGRCLFCKTLTSTNQFSNGQWFLGLLNCITGQYIIHVRVQGLFKLNRCHCLGLGLKQSSGKCKLKLTDLSYSSSKTSTARLFFLCDWQITQYFPWSVAVQTYWH